jgi:hypothetical protein
VNPISFEYRRSCFVLLTGTGFADKVRAMGFLALNRFKMTAPAVVMLATVVNAASMAGCVLSSNATPESAGMSERLNSGLCARADLSWAVRGGATHGAQTTRVLLARKAISDIHADLRSQARVAVHQTEHVAIPSNAFLQSREQGTLFSEQRHSHSNHQYSAP